MPFTPAEKRAHYKKRKAEEELKKDKQCQKIQDLAPSASKRKKPISQAKHGSKEDFGGHQRALNFPETPQGLIEAVEEKKEVQLSLDESPESMSAQPSADGSGERKIENLPIDQGFADRMPALSPDGKLIAFVHAAAGPIGNLWVIGTEEGAEPRALGGELALEVGVPGGTLHVLSLPSPRSASSSTMSRAGDSRRSSTSFL